MVGPDKQDVDLPNRAVGGARCAVCAEGHNTYEYEGLVRKGLAKDAPKYTAYGKDGHLVWDSRYAVRVREIRRKKTRIAVKVQRYNAYELRPAKTILRRERSLPDEEGWKAITDGAKKRKLVTTVAPRPGRPKTVAVAARRSGQTILGFNGKPAA